MDTKMLNLAAAARYLQQQGVLDPDAAEAKAYNLVKARRRRGTFPPEDATCPCGNPLWLTSTLDRAVAAGELLPAGQKN